MTSRRMGPSSGRVKRRLLGASLRGPRAVSSVTDLRELLPEVSFQCMTTTPQLELATTSSISGSVKPVTSFTMEAPSRTQIFAVGAWRVSMETTAPASARARTTGTTRLASSSAEMGVWPGRVDSPPTSMMSAPASSMSRPCWMAT